MLQPVEFGLAHPLGGEAHRQPLEMLADVKNLDQIVRRQRYDVRPDIRRSHDELASFQTPDRLAQRTTRDAELARQQGLAQPRPRLELAERNGLEQSIKDMIGQGPDRNRSAFQHATLDPVDS